MFYNIYLNYKRQSIAKKFFLEFLIIFFIALFFIFYAQSVQAAKIKIEWTVKNPENVLYYRLVQKFDNGGGTFVRTDPDNKDSDMPSDYYYTTFDAPTDPGKYQYEIWIVPKDWQTRQDNRQVIIQEIDPIEIEVGCTNDICDEVEFIRAESAKSVSDPIPPTEFCGDNTCNNGETRETCPGDCSQADVVINSENQKDMSKYSNKEVFLISDRDWKSILPIVPLTTWTGSENWCQRGYGTANNVCVYPMLIYHEEDSEIVTYNSLPLSNPFKPEAIKINNMNYSEWKKIINANIYFSLDSISYGEETFLNIELDLISMEYSNLLIETIEIIDWPYKDYLQPINNELSVEINKNLILGVTLPIERLLYFKYVNQMPNTITEKFDADSIYNFMEKYNAETVRVIGNFPQELIDLIEDENIEFGAKLGSDAAQKFENYLSYWDSYENIIYVEDNYELALMASTYASLINAPLVIKGDALDKQNTFLGKNVICVDTVTTGDNYCGEQYNLEQLQQKFITDTNTDKIILVNANDLQVNFKSDYQPISSANSISELYGKHSLAAPILASAKHELLYSVNSENYEIISSGLRTLTRNGRYNYLTIVASPEVVPMSIMVNSNELGYTGCESCKNMRELDNSLYASIDKDHFPELFTGRIFSLTISDVSSYINRVLFYDKIMPDYNNKATIQAYDPGGIMGGIPLSRILGDLGYDYIFHSDEDFNLPEVTKIGGSLNKLDLSNKNIYHYSDHGFAQGAGDLTTENISFSNIDLFPSVISTSACLTCSYTEEQNHLLCSNIIRHGAMAYIGATAISYEEEFQHFWNLLINKNKNIGQSFYELKQNNPSLFHMDMGFVYVLIGDPIFRPLLKQGDVNSIVKTYVNEIKKEKEININISFDRAIDFKKINFFELPVFRDLTTINNKYYFPVINYHLNGLNAEDKIKELEVIFEVGNNIIIKRRFNSFEEKTDISKWGNIHVDFFTGEQEYYEFIDLESGYTNFFHREAGAILNIEGGILIDYELENKKTYNIKFIKLWVPENSNYFNNWLNKHDEQEVKIKINVLLE